MARTPNDILERAYQRALSLSVSAVPSPEVTAWLEQIARNPRNRACARFLLACTLAKIHRPEVDIRKPYTEIGTPDAFSGRTYDERYIGPFCARQHLPCNPTTAFLTPAFRNQNTVLTPESNLSGRPPQLYQATLNVLDAVHKGQATADDVLTELLRWLDRVQEERQQRLNSFLATLDAAKDETSLASETIVSLVETHLSFERSSRLPVLVVAAIYQCAQEHLQEQLRPLYPHNAADAQTGALGDVEIVLQDTQRVVTVYEIKTRPIRKEDIALAVDKIARAKTQPDNYIFITTEPINPHAQEFARTLYHQTGTEFVILDCVGFLRHFLHLFHRLRMAFLEAYQALLIAEPESAVRQELKEVFLTMRLAAQSKTTDSSTPE